MVTNSATNTPTGASGTVLQGQGVGTASAFSTATFPSTATGTGTILRADGTNWVATTSTYPNTNAVNTLLYASSANVMSALPTANSGVLATDGSGVPSITATPTVTSITFGSGTALSNYLQSTFTPAMAFGGGTTGIAYSTQSGTYTRIGRMIFITLIMTLTSKGSSTGTATITGMPVAAGINSQILFCQADSLTYTGDTFPFCAINSGSSTLSIFASGSNTTFATMSDTNFANTTTIRVTGAYMA